MSAIWIDIKTRLKAGLSNTGNSALVALCEATGFLDSAEPALDRLMLRKTIDKIHSDWAKVSRKHGLKPTPTNISQFVQDGYDVPFDMPDDPDGGTLNREQRERIFTAVARILIGRGQVELAS